MKILLIVSSMHAGGAERVASTLVNAWAARGDDVTLLITYSGRGDCAYPIDPRVKLLWLADEVRSQGGGFAPVRRLLTLRRLIKGLMPSVVISFLTNVNIATLLVTRGLKIPVIVCERTNPSIVNNVGPVLHTLRRLIYPFATRVNVQSHPTAVGLKRMIPSLDCIDVIANPLPPELLGETLPLGDVPQKTSVKRVVAMGRLAADKQFDQLITIFSELADQYPDWELVIWGEGPARGALEAQVVSLGLQSRVSLPGRTSDAWACLSTGQIFAMTSRVEGFPNVLLEAMALGLPCLSYDCPSGPYELSEAGACASLIPLNDRTMFLQALKHLMDDPLARDHLAQQAQHSVRRRYAVDQIVSDWDAVFARLQNDDRQGYRP